MTGRTPGRAAGGLGLASRCGESLRGPSSGPQIISTSHAHGTNACLSHFPAQKSPRVASRYGTKCACLSKPSHCTLPLPSLQLQAWRQAPSFCQPGQTQAPRANLPALTSPPPSLLPREALPGSRHFPQLMSSPWMASLPTQLMSHKPGSMGKPSLPSSPHPTPPDPLYPDPPAVPTALLPVCLAQLPSSMPTLFFPGLPAPAFCLGSLAPSLAVHLLFLDAPG